MATVIQVCRSSKTQKGPINGVRLEVRLSVSRDATVNALQYSYSAYSYKLTVISLDSVLLISKLMNK